MVYIFSLLKIHIGHMSAHIECIHLIKFNFNNNYISEHIYTHLISRLFQQNTNFNFFKEKKK